MVAKEVQKLMIDKGFNKKQLSERCNWSQSNLYNKLKRDNFSESEMQTLAQALNCTLKIEFIPKGN